MTMETEVMETEKPTVDWRGYGAPPDRECVNCGEHSSFVLEFCTYGWCENRWQWIQRGPSSLRYPVRYLPTVDGVEMVICSTCAWRSVDYGTEIVVDTRGRMDNMRTCQNSECGVLYIEGEGVYNDEHDAYFCGEGCHVGGQEGREHIHSYHGCDHAFRPSINNWHIGVELEVEHDNGCRCGASVGDVINAFGVDDFFHAEDDCSVDGVEFVTAPLCYNGDRNLLHALVREISNAGFSGGKCGNHYHISRTFFGNNVKQQQFGLAKLALLVERCEDDLRAISGREDTCGDIDSWAPFYRKDRKTLQVVHTAAKNSWAGLRGAINLCNVNTVEFRFFGSTTDADVVLARIDLLVAMCHRAKEMRLDQINSVTNLRDALGSRYDKGIIALLKESGV